MSWEANLWATKQRMKLPQEQLVLIVLGNCADPDGVAFSKWPGKDHWWHYLAKVTRLSRSSVFRHLNTIVALGLASRSMLVLSDGSRRPTITLDLGASFDIGSEESRYLAALQSHRRDQSHGETEDDDVVGDEENANNGNALEEENSIAPSQSHHETVKSSPTHGTDRVPPVGLHIDSIEDSNISPLPPSGGASTRDELWGEFAKAWAEPIPKMALARSGWERIETAKRPKCIAAAKGYRAWLRKHQKPPAEQSAQSFVRDEAGWDQWLRYVPEGGGFAPATSGSHPRDSTEARALIRMHDAFGVGEGFRKIYVRDVVTYRKPVTPQILAFAEMPPREKWVTIDHRQAGAWSNLGRDLSAIPRTKVFQAGDAAPWWWPPSADGKLYTSATGPPAAELSEQDLADFR